MDRMPNLRIYRDVSPEVAQQIVAVLLNMPGGTTFCVTELGVLKGSRRVWMSKRGYDYLKNHLQELKEQELI